MKLSFWDQALPHLEMTDAVQPSTIASIRDLLSQAMWQSQSLAPAGVYRYMPVEQLASSSDLVDTIVALVEKACPTSVERAAGHFMSLGHGDYSLADDDARWLRRHPANLEVCLDVSDQALGQGEIVYTHRGQPFFMPTQQPGTLSVVHRGPTVARFDRYLNHRVGTGRVQRLRLHLTVA